MSDMWIVNVNGRDYGPYTLEQMQGFIAEGRVVAQSVIGHADGGQSHVAADDPVFAAHFAPAAPIAAAEPLRKEETPAPSFGRQDEKQSNTPSHVVIVADMKSRSITGLEEEIYNMGQAYPIFPQTWLLTTEMPVNAIRNILMQKLGKLDVIFIVDATLDKAAWFNFGPEAETRIRRVWGKDAQRKAS